MGCLSHWNLELRRRKKIEGCVNVIAVIESNFIPTLNIDRLYVDSIAKFEDNTFTKASRHARGIASHIQAALQDHD